MYYSYVDGKVTTTNNGKDSSYYNLVRRPKHAFGATIGYQVTKNLFVSTNVYTYGKRYDLDFDPNPPYGSIMAPLNSYTIWNAYAEYKLLNNRIRIFADLKKYYRRQIPGGVGLCYTRHQFHCRCCCKVINFKTETTCH